MILKVRFSLHSARIQGVLFDLTRVLSAGGWVEIMLGEKPSDCPLAASLVQPRRKLAATIFSFSEAPRAGRRVRLEAVASRRSALRRTAPPTASLEARGHGTSRPLWLVSRCRQTKLRHANGAAATHAVLLRAQAEVRGRGRRCSKRDVRIPHACLQPREPSPDRAQSLRGSQQNIRSAAGSMSAQRGPSSRCSSARRTAWCAAARSTRPAVPAPRA